jgi:hypothetical protein
MDAKLYQNWQRMIIATCPLSGSALSSMDYLLVGVDRHHRTQPADRTGTAQAAHADVVALRPSPACFAGSAHCADRAMQTTTGIDASSDTR